MSQQRTDRVSNIFIGHGGEVPASRLFMAGPDEIVVVITASIAATGGVGSTYFLPGAQSEPIAGTHFFRFCKCYLRLLVSSRFKMIAAEARALVWAPLKFSSAATAPWNATAALNFSNRKGVIKVNSGNWPTI